MLGTTPTHTHIPHNKLDILHVYPDLVQTWEELEKPSSRKEQLGYKLNTVRHNISVYQQCIIQLDTM